VFCVKLTHCDNIEDSEYDIDLFGDASADSQ